MQTHLIGASRFITTETFNNRDVALYPLLDNTSSIIGTQLIFGAKNSQKRIYEIRNPSEECEFKKYYLNEIRNIEYLANRNDDRACLVNVRYNQLRLKHIDLFNCYD